MKSPFFILILLFIASLSLTGCYKDDLNEFKNLGNPQIDQEWAVPLIYDELNMDYWVIGAPQVTMQDTASIELPSVGSDTAKYIVSATFKGHTENTFPVDGHFQIYFVNDLGVIADSLFSVSESVVIMPSGGNPGVSDPTIVVDQARYNSLSGYQSMIFRLTLNTLNSPIAQITYAPYKFSFKVGVKTKISIPL